MFARSYGQTTGILPWREVLLSFNATHPLLTSTSHEAGILAGKRVSSRARLECVAIQALKERVRSVCVVGNGPLSPAQRTQILSCDVIIRFNQLNTRLCGERLDIWVVRYAGHVPARYHGLNNTVACGVGKSMEATRAVWLVDGAIGDRRWDVQQALDRVAGLAQRMWMPLDTQVLRDNYHRLVDSKSTASTGWLGMMLALQCAPEGSRVHLFGFNWSRKHWQKHRMASEEHFARAMHAAGRVFIHWPICNGLRNCDHCAEAEHTGKLVKGCFATGKESAPLKHGKGSKHNKMSSSSNLGNRKRPP